VRDLVLDREAVVEVAVESLGPEVKAVGALDELRSDRPALAKYAATTLRPTLSRDRSMKTTAYFDVDSPTP